MNSLNKAPDKRLALVIGSGAVKCAAALGLWKVLKREGIDIDLLVGCSGGSLYAATMALGFDIDDCIDKTKRLWNRKITAKRDNQSILRAIFPKFFKFDERFGMMDDAAVLKSLQAVFAEKSFSDTHTPLFIVATDFRNGDQIVLSEGKLVDAIRASISIPYIWRPYAIDGRLMIDGSTSNPMPVDVAIKEGAEIILAMGFESPFPRKVKSISRFAFHINSLMTNNLMRANFSFHNLAHHAEIIPILPNFEREIGLFDTRQFAHVIDQGEKAMEEQLPYLHRLLQETIQKQENELPRDLAINDEISHVEE